MPSFGRIEWAVERMPFVPPGPYGGISGMGMVGVGGSIYVMGGYIPAGDETPDRASRETSLWTYRYDPPTRRWTRLADLPGRREYLRAIEGDGRVYAVGGGSQMRGTAGFWAVSADCFVLDPVSPASGWKSCGQLTVPRSHMGVGRVGQYLVVAGGSQYDRSVGGYHESTRRGTTDIFDLRNPRLGWVRKSPIPGSPRGWTAAATLGERLFVFGGLGVPGPLSETLSYDPKGDQWRTHTPFPTAVSGWEGGSYEGRYVILAGGHFGVLGGRHVWNDLPFVYDAREDRWLRIDSPLPPGGVFNDPGVVIMGRDIYVAGGEGPKGSHYDYFLVGRIHAEVRNREAR